MIKYIFIFLLGSMGIALAADTTLSITVTTDNQPPVTGLLPPDRDASANWKKAGMLSVGGILNRTTQCGSTINPRGNGQDDTSNIQNAINSCPNDQFVKLAAGTFTLPEGKTLYIERKSITLRGAGLGKTILHRTGGATMGSYFPGSQQSHLIALGRGVDSSAGTALSSDAVQGGTTVQVANTSGFQVGQFVLLNEASGASWQPDPLWTQYQIWASPDGRVVWQKHKPQGPADDFGSSSYPSDSGSAGCWFSFCDRPTNEVKQIKSIAGNTITFDSPVMISYRVANQAKLYYLTNMTTNAGVEDLTMEYADNANIRIEGCAYCWMKNSESRFYLNGGVTISASFRVQLDGNYFHEAAWPVNGGAGYNIMLNWESSEILIQNNISMLANKVIVAQSAGAGSVVAYNYMDDAYINDQTWVETGINASHMVGPHHVLFEGNLSFNAESDSTHGNSIYMTFFRNYLTGFRAPFKSLGGPTYDDTKGCCGLLRAASPHTYSYWFSFLGNVFGTPGKMNGWVYEDNGGPNRFPKTSIWALGWMDISPQGTDPKVPPSTIRNGNYDFVTNSQKWATDDTAHALPDSMYLDSAPSFFSGYTWPWVDPSNGTIKTLPAKARLDAGTP